MWRKISTQKSLCCIIPCTQNYTKLQFFCSGGKHEFRMGQEAFWGVEKGNKEEVKVNFLSDGNIHFFNCDGEFIDRNIYIKCIYYIHLKYVQFNVNTIYLFSE